MERCLSVSSKRGIRLINMERLEEKMNLLEAAKVTVTPQSGVFNQITRRYVLKRFLGGATAHELAKEYGVTTQLIEETIQQAKLEEEGKEIKTMELSKPTVILEDSARQRRIITKEDKQFIIKLKEQGMSVNDIANEHGYAKSTIYRTLQAHERAIHPDEVKATSKREPKQYKNEEDIVKRYLEGEGIIKLQEEYKISTYALYRILERHGIDEEKREARKLRLRVTKDVVDKFLNHYSIPRIADDLEISEDLVKEILSIEDKKHKAKLKQQEEVSRMPIQERLDIKEETDNVIDMATYAVCAPMENVYANIETKAEQEIRELKSVIESLQSGIQIKQAKINELMTQLASTQVTTVKDKVAEENQAMRQLLKLVL